MRAGVIAELRHGPQSKTPRKIHDDSREWRRCIGRKLAQNTVECMIICLGAVPITYAPAGGGVARALTYEDGAIKVKKKDSIER